MGLAGLIGRQTEIFLSRGGMGVKPVKPAPTDLDLKRKTCKINQTGPRYPEGQSLQAGS
jgi:hypothetical protein